ncbi:Prolyl aminopeptidase [Hyphodiscus hymeniophilus]|uniref:Proline iminopeptidase n=1 Tax=Hyphodiscus hymeniophilus TaxID=353542 RepID=A0A9P6VHD0_9HELO|nr:Prolyl aminopeptidase [Hyphodiscus hymeniophilus]
MAFNLPSTIRTWQYTSARGGIEKNLKLNPSAPILTPSQSQSLVRIISVALNPADYKPAEVPIAGRLLVPKYATPGIDFAGLLIKPSPGCSLKAGQLVFGVSGTKPFAAGALSEYNTVEDDCFTAIPEGVDLVDASTVGVAGLTAYQSIVPNVKKGDRIFINGGSGGCGVFGIQIAKVVGCHVTTCCSTPNVELCKSLGADEVVDYKKGSVVEALKKSGVKFDFLVDNVGSDPDLYWRSHEFLKEDAMYVMVGHSISWKGFANSWKRKIIPSALGGGKRKLSGFWPKPNSVDLERIGRWMAEGKIKAVIDQRFAFEKTITMAPLYAAFAVNQSGHLQVSPIHSIYYEECGDTKGVPILYLHGGPGGGIEDDDRRYFDPSHYRSILFDQRGSGKSTPHASLEDNTTWSLVSDIESLREHLKVEKWIVFGGSWGSTLSLAYAEKHPERCLGLILRGIFTLQRSELEWFYQKGADMLFPDYFDAYKKVIPEAERGDMMGAYYKRLTGDNEEEKLKCAGAWSTWETSTSKLIVDPEYIKKAGDPKWALAFARIESHFFVNGGWLEDGQLIRAAPILKDLPIVIIQGRYDVVCPAKTSWELYQALGGESNKNVEYKIIGDSGHSAHEKSIEEALVDAADKFKSIKA